MTRRVSEQVAVACPCGAQFVVPDWRLTQGRGRYCSRACMYRYRTRPTGLIYVKHKDNPTSFKPGVRASPATEFGAVPAWNKGLRGRHFSPETEFKPGANQKEENVRWAGNDVGYSGLHGRVYRERGSAANHLCQHADITCKGPMNWANISGDYRDVDDFMPLCRAHHIRYDKLMGFWGRET